MWTRRRRGYSVEGCRASLPESCYYHLQARIVGLNGQYFLKNGGNFVISIKASCIDSTAVPEAVFAREVKKLQEMQMKPKEQVRGRQSADQPYCSSCRSRVAWLIHLPTRSDDLDPAGAYLDWTPSSECAVHVQVTLEPYERDHAMVVGVFRPPPKAKA